MVGVAVFVLAVVGLAVRSLHRGMGTWAMESRVDWARAVWGAVEQAIEIEGILVRDEKVLVAPISGIVRPLVSEGEKVSAGSVLAEVAEDDARQRAEPPLRQAEDELARFDAYARSRLEGFESEVAARKLDVENEKRALAMAGSSPDGDGSAGDRASALARARRAYEEASARLEAERAELERRRRSLADKVRQCEEGYRRFVSQMRAESPGVVSFELDGLEQVLSPDGCKDIEPGEAMALVPSPGRVAAGEHVDAGQPVFRLVDNYRLFVLALLPRDASERLGSSRSLRLRFQSVPGGPFAASRVFHDASIAPDSARAMLLEVSGFPTELCYGRRVRVSVIERTVSGLVVPRRSIVSSDEGDFVYVPVNLGVARKPVRIRAACADRAVVEGLREGERVAENPGTVREARVTIWR